MAAKRATVAIFVALLLPAPAAATLLGVEDAETLTTVGQIHLGAERFADAERVLRSAIAQDPENAHQFETQAKPAGALP